MWPFPLICRLTIYSGYRLQYWALLFHKYIDLYIFRPSEFGIEGNSHGRS
jgi:hypothetical protein